MKRFIYSAVPVLYFVCSISFAQTSQHQYYAPPRAPAASPAETSSLACVKSYALLQSELSVDAFTAGTNSAEHCKAEIHKVAVEKSAYLTKGDGAARDPTMQFLADQIEIDTLMNYARTAAISVLQKRAEHKRHGH